MGAGDAASHSKAQVFLERVSPYLEDTQFIKRNPGTLHGVVLMVVMVMVVVVMVVVMVVVVVVMVMMVMVRCSLVLSFLN